MNMPVLPVTSANSAPADTAARPADTTAGNAPAFSNVLSGQQQQHGTSSPAPAQTAMARQPDANLPAKTAKPQQDPLGPDETLALILDSTGLPMMQLPVQPTALARFSIQGHAKGHAGHAATPDKNAPGIAGAANAVIPSGQNTDTAVAQLADGQARKPQAAMHDAQAHLNSKPFVADTEAGRATAGKQEALAGVATSPQAAARHSDRFLTAADITTKQISGRTSASPLIHPEPQFAAASPDTHTLGTTTALAAAQAPLIPAASTATPQQITVSTPFNSPQWPQDVSRQLFSLVQSGVAGSGHTVQMQLNPPELGPVHITLHLGDTGTQAAFVSPHANVRQALENALPQLAQQMAQAGVSLGQTSVSDQPGQQYAQSSNNQNDANHGAVFSLDGSSDDASLIAGTGPIPRAAHRPNAIVDTFA